MSLIRRFFTMSGLTIVSRIIGVFRETLLVGFLGASAEMDAFSIAFKFPSFFRRFFSEGGFQSIFIPYFTDFVAVDKLKGAKYFSSRVLSLVFWAMLFLTVLVHIYTREFVLIMAPGFMDFPEKLALTIKFTRIIFPSIAFVALSTIYSGILVSRHRFFPFAMAPILVNLILIISLLVGKDYFSAGTRISYGVLAAGIFQFAYMYICVRLKKFPCPRLAPIRLSFRVKSFLRRLVPVLIGAGVVQVNVLMSSFFASFLPTGNVTYLYCADRFVQLPLAIFGISMGIILLPEISEQIAKGRNSDITNIQRKSILFTMRLTLPSVVGLVTLSYYMISILYGHGKFDVGAVQNTSDVLKIASLGLPAFVISKIISSVLFAQKDTRTPVIAAIASIVANIVLSWAFIGPLKVIGLAAASSIAGFVNVIVMGLLSKGWFRFDRNFSLDILKIIISSIIMLLATVSLGRFYLDYLAEDINFTMGKFQEILYVASLCIVGIVAYIVSLLLFKDHAVISFLKRFVIKSE